MRGSKFILVSAITALLLSTVSVEAYILTDRWSATATDGGGLVNGDPTIITWGIVPDGTPIPNETGPSDFVSTFDARFGAGPGGSDLTQRPWFPLLEQSFDRWSELSSLTFVYEPEDDGVQMFSQLSDGSLGNRADNRVAGTFQDGQGGVLAYASFPNTGDTVFDTGDLNNFDNTANNFRFLRNTLMHEVGHTIGLSHIESSTSSFLMEPFINTSFDGPQLDDIRGLHRGYGDRFEKSNNGAGNDVIQNATHLGSPDASPIVIGTEGSSTRVEANEFDFISIDQNTDTDFFAFTVSSAGMADISVTPQGTTFNQGAQGGSQSSFSTFDTSDLTLVVYDSDQSTVLANVDATSAGSGESVTDLELPAGGDYYVRIQGDADNMQFYRLDISVELTPGTPCDFDGDGNCDCGDVDSLVAAIAGGSGDLSFDLDGDGLVNTSDLDMWLAEAGAQNLPSGNSYLKGDANLDGVVDVTDLNVWSGNKFTEIPAWCSGDFNADGVVDVTDLNIWSGNKFGSALDSAVVPEPTALVLLLVGAACSFRRKRRAAIHRVPVA